MPQSTNDRQTEKGLLAIFKGESGEGKSVAALSFPNSYTFDFDRKMPSIAQKHFPGKEFFWDTFETIIDALKQIEDFRDHGCPYETLLIDSISGMVQLCLNTYFQYKGLSIKETIYSMNNKKQVESIPIDFYNSEDRACTYLVEQLKYLWARDGNPRHVIFTAHVVTVSSDPNPLKQGAITQTRGIAAKGKKFPAWLPTGFDNVYIFGRQLPVMGEIDQSVKRIIKTEAFGEDSAKCSFNFPETIDFTNGSLYDKLVSFGLPTGIKRIGTEIHDAEFVNDDPGFPYTRSS